MAHKAAPVDMARSGGAGAAATPAPQRKIRRNAEARLLVSNVETAVRAIAALGEREGGFVESSTLNGGSAAYGNIAIRVPAARLDAVLEEIRKQAVQVDSLETHAEDVTAEFVDLDARLKNLRLTEVQLQEIMRRSGSIADTLKVVEQLGSVREQIERLQGQFQLLNHQIEMSEIKVALHSDVAASRPGRWRLGSTAAKSYETMLDGLAHYVSAMLAFFMRLPIILLWMATIGLFGWVVIRLLIRFFGSSFLTKPPSGTQAK